MTTKFSYACRDYPGMEACPFHVTTESQDELVKLVEMHASLAHGEDPSQWSEEDRAYLMTLVKTE